MPARAYIHVIDHDSRRRARVSRELLNHNVHAELYEDLDEFCRVMPEDGAVLAIDEHGIAARDMVFAAMKDTGKILPVALYSDQPTPQRIVEAMRNGALDYLQWPFDLRLLAHAVDRLVTEGNKTIERERRRSASKALVSSLSNRERQVLSLLVEGLSNKDMAERLGISARTIEIHRGNMMRKLNARSASDAVRIGLLFDVSGTDPEEDLLAA